MDMSMNRGLKSKLQAGGVAIGSFIKAASPVLTEIIGMSGMDYILLDLEHSPVSMEEVENLVRAADSVGVCSIVRVAGHGEADILYALDKGPGGILVPMVSDKETAARVVNHSRFAPIGRRGMDIYSRAARFGYTPKKDYLSKANKEVLLAIQIEGEEGVDHLDDILSVDGLDIIYVGPYDLSQSLGIPGQVGDPRVVSMVEEIAQKARAKGRFTGIYVDDVETAHRYANLGVQFITISVDVRIFAQACDSIVRDFRTV
jgi:4-hydroxy-2-oxoheptanedioate aldolase